jgi:hypothetical protein
MYFITCFEKYEKDELGWPNIGTSRTFGYYNCRDWAIEDLHKNNTDLHEILYDYAVVEKIPAGLYPLAEETIYFKWDEEKQGFYEIDVTDMQDCFGNYAFG